MERIQLPRKVKQTASDSGAKKMQSSTATSYQLQQEDKKVLQKDSALPGPHVVGEKDSVLPGSHVVGVTSGNGRGRETRRARGRGRGREIVGGESHTTSTNEVNKKDEKMFDTESTCGGRVEQEKVVNEGQEEETMNMDIEQWSTLDVSMYFAQHSLQVFADLCVPQNIDGSALCELNQSDLEKLGLTVGIVKNVLKKIRELKSPESKKRPAYPCSEGPSKVPKLDEVQELANTYELANLSDLPENELLWYNMFPTLHKDQLKRLAGQYDPKYIRKIPTPRELAAQTKIDVDKCQQIITLITPQSVQPPSMYGIIKNFPQDGSIYCDRFTNNVVPCSDLSLVSKPIIAFQEALTRFKGLSANNKLLYQHHAVKLLHTMEALDLTDEQNMYDLIQNLFRDILTDVKHVSVGRWSTPNKSGMGQHIQCDGSVLVKGLPCIVAEAKALQSKSPANPVLQAIGYFQHMVNSFGSVNLTCALLVTFDGDWMSIYGCHAFVNFDGSKQLLVDLLCHPLLLRFKKNFQCLLENIASVLYCIVCFVEHISKDAPKLESCPLTLAKILQKVSPSFTPTGPLRRMCPNKLLFEFEFKENDQERVLAVKFVKGDYGEEVHRHLSYNCYAPKLYKVIDLPLDWKAVVMERLSSSLDEPSDYTTQLVTIVKYLHDKNYVHGDLRKPNILNVNGKLQICDFDWAGVEGVAKYPFDINHRDLIWPRDNLPGEIIKKDDDIYWIHQ